MVLGWAEILCSVALALGVVGYWLASSRSRSARRVFWILVAGLVAVGTAYGALVDSRPGPVAVFWGLALALMLIRIGERADVAASNDVPFPNPVPE